MKRLLFCLYNLISNPNCAPSYQHIERTHHDRMKVLNIFFFSFLATALFLGSCNEPSLIGSELVEDEQGVLLFTDSLSITMENVEGDSLIGYSPLFANYSNYLFGDFDDPIFGTSKAEIYFRIVGPGFYPDFDDAERLDSAVLVIPLDSAATYGDLSKPFEYELFELSEKPSNDENYYTDTTLMVEPMPLHSGFFTPNLSDTLALIEANSDGEEDEVKVVRELRIPLPMEFAERLFNTDSLSYESDSIFAQTFKGFYLKAVNKTNAMAAFDLVNSRAGISLYFHQTDTTFRRFPFTMDRLIIPSYEQDVTGSPVQDILDNQSTADSLFVLQAMEGQDIKIQLPDISSLGDIIINKAEIEFTIASLPGDDADFYRPIDQLVLTYPLDTDGTTRSLINDVNFIGTGNVLFGELFGGQVFSSNGKRKYSVAISAHLQDVLSGTIENTLYLEPFQRAQKASRVVLYGPSSQSNPPKLKLYYTESTN